VRILPIYRPTALQSSAVQVQCICDVDVVQLCEKNKPSAPPLRVKSLSQQSLDSAYLSGRKEYPYIKRLDTSDP